MYKACKQFCNYLCVDATHDEEQVDVVLIHDVHVGSEDQEVHEVYGHGHGHEADSCHEPHTVQGYSGYSHANKSGQAVDSIICQGEDDLCMGGDVTQYDKLHICKEDDVTHDANIKLHVSHDEPAHHLRPADSQDTGSAHPRNRGG